MIIRLVFLYACSTADESRILSWSGGTVYIWDAANGVVLHTFPHNDEVNGAAWNRDESRILSWSFDSTTRLWNATSGELIHTLSHDDPVLGATWNGDESRIVSWSVGSTVHLWDSQTGLVLQALSGDGLNISSVKWNRAETEIILTTEEGHIYRYYTRMPDLLAAACTRATRNLTWSEWQQYLPGEPYRLTCPTLPPHPSVPAEALVAAGIPPVATPHASPLPTSTPRP